MCVCVCVCVCVLGIKGLIVTVYDACVHLCVCICDCVGDIQC